MPKTRDRLLDPPRSGLHPPHHLLAGSLIDSQAKSIRGDVAAPPEEHALPDALLP